MKKRRRSCGASDSDAVSAFSSSAMDSTEGIMQVAIIRARMCTLTSRMLQTPNSMSRMPGTGLAGSLLNCTSTRFTWTERERERESKEVVKAQ